MGINDVEKTTKEILGGSKSATAKALIVVAMSMDNMTSAIIENQKKVDERISAHERKVEKEIECLTNSTNKKLDKLKFWSMISDYSWIAAILIIAVIVIMIWSVAEQNPFGGVKLFK